MEHVETNKKLYQINKISDFIIYLLKLMETELACKKSRQRNILE